MPWRSPTPACPRRPPGAAPPARLSDPAGLWAAVSAFDGGANLDGFRRGVGETGRCPVEVARPAGHHLVRPPAGDYLRAFDGVVTAFQYPALGARWK